MKSENKLMIIILVITIVLFFALQNSKNKDFITLNNFAEDIIVYKSLSCGCCGIYANYLKSKGNKNAEIIDMVDISSIKKDYGVPVDLESCHTTIIGNYFVEGHIPLEAVEKLLSEKPDIAGIAMPGMPSGSPGMPGNKYGDFIIYGVNHNGSSYEFMRI